MESSQEQYWMGKARFLTQALIFSGTLNIGFLSTAIYFSLQDKQETIAKEIFEEKREIFTNEQILRAYSRASFSDLLLRLENSEKAEEGCARRDLALACLATFHYFPVEKALGGEPVQKREISFATEKGPIPLTLFVGLREEQFEAVLRFAKTERWPLTAKGLFLAICQSSFPWDPSLLQAFYMTGEFRSILSLLQKYLPSVPEPLVVAMIKEGSWDLFHRFCEKIDREQSYDIETYREFLTRYFSEASSKIAVDLLRRYESEYVVKRFDDKEILRFLDFHKENTDRIVSIAKELLTAPRSDLVRERAASILYAAAGEEIPPYNYETAVARFFPESSPVETVPSVPAEAPGQPDSPGIHKIVQGDSLWKIARKYKVSVEALMQYNHLESERLRIGRELRIPEEKSP